MLPPHLKNSVTAALENYCDQKIPAHVRSLLRLTFAFRSNNVTLYEERPRYNDPSQWTRLEIAQFRFNDKSKKWTLYCKFRNRWLEHPDSLPTRNFQELLKQLDADPTGLFWG
jgi:hypothetical protein